MNTQQSLFPTWQEKLEKATALFEQVLRESPAVYQASRETQFGSSDVVVKFCTARIGLSEREEFLVLFLDNQHRLIKAEVMFQGSINKSQVHPREIVKLGLKLNAAAVLLSHNHPSGETKPSQADKVMTQKIKQACELVDIRVLDHVIVAPDTHYSFAENNEEM
ncbi:JAB domain-containing protein [Exercitatus varius]|uniref:JAB domain-containing protein n=1 Tax=Exercitatus varius TaxID=67857 RepID=UPI00294ABEC2|nr:DNA repair protein RadC [Exercitatus varius]MDG2961727.1 DNA repair protein RadC [Exercitatus varius]